MARQGGLSTDELVRQLQLNPFDTYAMVYNSHTPALPRITDHVSKWLQNHGNGNWRRLANHTAMLVSLPMLGVDAVNSRLGLITYLRQQGPAAGIHVILIKMVADARITDDAPGAPAVAAFAPAAVAAAPAPAAVAARGAPAQADVDVSVDTNNSAGTSGASTKTDSSDVTA